MNVFAIILTIFVFLIIAIWVIGSFITDYFDNRDHNKQVITDLVYVSMRGWRVTNRYSDGITVMAPDEKRERYLDDAVTRQKELDRIKRLNLPSEALRPELPDPEKIPPHGQWRRR